MVGPGMDPLKVIAWNVVPASSTTMVFVSVVIRNFTTLGPPLAT